MRVRRFAKNRGRACDGLGLGRGLIGRPRREPVPRRLTLSAHSAREAGHSLLVTRAGVIGVARPRPSLDRGRQLLVSQVLRLLDLHDRPVVPAGWTRNEAVRVALGRLRLQRPSTLLGFGSGHEVMYGDRNPRDHRLPTGWALRWGHAG
jgi:hypothetical protein